MVNEFSVFGIRFGSNLEIEPGPEDLAQFLASPKKPGSRVKHEADLAQFRELVQMVAAYDKDSQRPVSRLDIRDRMFYSVLSYSLFFSPALLGAVERYKYHLHQFLSLDFRKPESFIRAAEREIAGLNQKKKSDAEKIARLKDLIRERKNSIKAMGKQKDELAREMQNIIKYVRDNVSRISGRCEKAVIFLVQLHIEGSEERRLIADLKNQFSQDLQDGFQSGEITKADVEAVKKDFDVLTTEIAALMREDFFALSSLYEAIQEHTKTIAERIQQLLTEAAKSETYGADSEPSVFSRVEDALIALLSGPRLVFKPFELSSKTRYRAVLEKKREEMLASFQEHVRKERRTRTDRRSGVDRRQFHDTNFKPERRSGKERRIGKGRRRI